jgi:hypothetical protein
MPRLLVNPGTPHQWEIPLKAGANTLGRSATCDGQVDHESVSGTHCEITINGESVLVKDLGSTNGTFLNRAPIREAPLAAGQRLQLGGVEMELITDTPRTAANPVAVRIARPVATSTSATAPAATSTPADSLSATTPAAPRLSVRLASASHEPAAPPPSAPAAYVPDEYSAEPSGPAMCKYHPKTTASYLCPQCQLHYCDLCVTSRPDGTRTGKFCRKCSTECVAMNVQLLAPVDRHANFFTSLPGAFAYPLKAKSLTFLACGTLFFALVDFLGSYSIYLRIVYIGYTFAYLQRVIHTAAQGSDEAAGWPDISAFWDDIFVPFLQTMGLFLICFGPAIGLMFWAGFEAVQGGNADPTKMVLIIPALIGGAVYYPMALLALAMFDSIVSANPLVVIPAIIRVPLQYLVVLVVTGIILVVRIAQSFLIDLIPVPVLPKLITACVVLYFLTVQGRMLGLMYYAKRHKLGWFNR